MLLYSDICFYLWSLHQCSTTRYINILPILQHYLFIFYRKISRKNGRTKKRKSPPSTGRYQNTNRKWQCPFILLTFQGLYFFWWPPKDFQPSVSWTFIKRCYHVVSTDKNSTIAYKSSCTKLAQPQRHDKAGAFLIFKILNNIFVLGFKHISL